MSHQPLGARRLLGLFLLLLALGARGADSRLDGLWLVDAEASDPARRRIDAALRSVTRDLRPRSRGGPSRPAPPGIEGLLAPLQVPRETVALALSEDAVELRVDGGRTERVYTDGRPSVVDADNPGVAIAAWERGALWIERTSDRGTRVIERWSHADGVLRADYEVRNGLLDRPLEFTLFFTAPEEGPNRP
ncbi:MAG: hypothetical protein V2I63_07725 [Pseudomonadales bacterium]|jgi:hypothetical protein|nr:hypothetical protein [Pseudomonadales bacterium]